MSIPTRPDGGSATPVMESTNEPLGSVAIPVYEVDADTPVLGGAAIPVLVITDSDLIENGGTYHLDGRPSAFPISTKSSPYPVQAGKALPIYVVNGATSPDAPTGLTATNDVVGQIDLSWNASVGATSYNIKRATVDGGPYITIQTGNVGTTFSDTTTVNGTTYYYVVSAVNDDGESSNSNQASGVSLNWWEAGGASGCVGAYLAKGAASYAAAKVNLANPGTYDLTEFGSPSFGAGGITFTMAADKFLTGITPAANWSGFIQVTNVVVTSEKHFGYGIGGMPSFGVYIRYSDGNTYYSNGLEAAVPSLGVTGGNFGIAGDKAYRNGADEGITLGSWTGSAGNIFIGTAPYTLVALSIYNTVLTAPQALAVATAMAAL